MTIITKILIMWEIRKHKLHDSDSRPGDSQSSPKDLLWLKGRGMVSSIRMVSLVRMVG